MVNGGCCQQFKIGDRKARSRENRDAEALRHGESRQLELKTGKKISVAFLTAGFAFRWDCVGRVWSEPWTEVRPVRSGRRICPILLSFRNSHHQRTAAMRDETLPIAFKIIVNMRVSILYSRRVSLIEIDLQEYYLDFVVSRVFI